MALSYIIAEEGGGNGSEKTFKNLKVQNLGFFYFVVELYRDHI